VSRCFSLGISLALLPGGRRRTCPLRRLLRRTSSAIKNIYNAAEPWVRYGFEVATYAVGWVPYVGWLSPQIMIFYNFGERIVRSIATGEVIEVLDTRSQTGYIAAREAARRDGAPPRRGGITARG
jgi:hypothetical protein